ncbi:MAG TPA: tetratricopeptide repeat protein [Thermoanaerobaculia bacterium]|nr:tetratricopeptide repeat protein [Thermoanaerobaculia bacterium]
MKPRPPKRVPQRPERRKATSPLFWVVLPLLALALLAQTGRMGDRLQAARMLWQVEVYSRAAIARGVPRGLIPMNLEVLRRAAVLDATEVGIPIARGTQYLLLGNGSLAAHAYREALALEPRPEIYLNLGRALLVAGEPEEARRQFEMAVRLDPNLAALVPPELTDVAP